MYRRHKLYYVGLASDLKWRINHHLRDRHKGKWDRFSLYIVRKEGHIREVESLLVRIAEPGGNQQRGKLGGSKNLVSALDKGIKERQNQERKGMLGDRKGKAEPKKTKKNVRKTKITKERPFRRKFPGAKVIYAKYKGKVYKVWVKRNEGIKFKGQIYDTPTGAAKT